MHDRPVRMALLLRDTIGQERDLGLARFVLVVKLL